MGARSSPRCMRRRGWRRLFVRWMGLRVRRLSCDFAWIGRCRPRRRTRGSVELLWLRFRWSRGEDSACLRARLNVQELANFLGEDGGHEGLLEECGGGSEVGHLEDVL